MKNLSIGQISDFEIKQLKVFKAVVEAQGFAAAEISLDISPPAISAHIANLEARLNVVLCQRGRSGFLLTEAGQVVYEQTNELLLALNNFKNNLSKLSSTPTGCLNIAFSDTLSLDPRCQLPKIIQRFSQVAPQVELHFSVEHMNEMEKKILNNELDVAFIPYHHPLDAFDYLHLFTDINYLYCSKNSQLFPLSEHELTDELINTSPLIHAGLRPHQAVNTQLADMQLSGVSYFYETRIAMILSGQYIGFLPEFIAHSYVSQNALKAIATKSKFFTLATAVISKKTTSPNRNRMLFLKTVKEVLAELSSTLPPY